MDRSTSGTPPEEIWSLCREILLFFIEHPRAQDTLEGIAEWWLLERAIARQAPRIPLALDRLVDLGLVIAAPAGDGRVHYRLNRERLAEAQAATLGERP